MKPIAIVTDSTSDLPALLATQLHIHVVPCNVHFGQEVYRERVDLTTDQFYEKLATAKELPKTSQPSVGVFTELYQTLAKNHDGIISIHLAAKLSGTYQSAALAAKEVTGIPIATIDSGTTSMSLGWLAVIAARVSQTKQDFESIVATVNAAVPRTRLLALLENLDNVVKGGRVGKAAALVSGILSIKPILEIKNGDVNPVERIRTWQKAKARLVELTKAFGTLDELAVMHAHAPDDALVLAEQLSAFYPRDRIVITEAGAVLGTHAGRGALGVMVVVH
jgi:DegV family protein with EDD domain